MNARPLFRFCALPWCLALSACNAPAANTDAADASVEASSLACRSDRECSASGQVCDRSVGRCVDCLASTDCLGANQRCTRGMCVAIVPCTTSRMCPGQVCDMALGQCVDCVSDNDCPTTELCRESRCVPRPTMCRSSRECSAMAQVCDLARSICVDCVAAADCAPDERCTQDRCVRVPGAEPAPDVVVPPLDVVSPRDVVTPPPDVPVAMDVFAPDVLVPDVVTPDVVVPEVVVPPVDAGPRDVAISPEDDCPGAPLPLGTLRTIDWSRARASSDLPTACGAMLMPGAWRDVLFSIELPRGGDLRISLGPSPTPLTYELRTNCWRQLTPQCGTTRVGSSGLQIFTQYLEAGTYYLALEQRETELSSGNTVRVDYGTQPSSWTYVTSTPAGVAFEDICGMMGAQQQLPMIDDAIAQVPSPFRVQVFDVESFGSPAMLSVSSNGWFSVQTSTSALARSLTGNTSPNGMVNPYNADLVTTERGVCSLVTGTAPNRRLVLQWDRARRFGSMNMAEITVQAIVYEAAATTPNTIDFVYQTLTDPATTLVRGLRGTFLDAFPVTTAVTAPSVVRLTPMRR